MSGSDEGGFLSRWARRKAQAGQRSKAVEGASGTGAERRAPIVEAGDAPATHQQPPGQQPPAAVIGTAAPPCEVASATGRAGSSTPAAALPTLEDVAKLTRDSDYSRFVGPGVPGEVRNAALKRLFSDPHFNVMDGLDTYIDDYGRPDPIPVAMLRQLNQSRLLGLFEAEDEKDGPCGRASSNGGAAVPVAASMPSDRPADARGASLAPPDDDPDLRLQQDDGPERAGPAPGAGA